MQSLSSPNFSLSNPVLSNFCRPVQIFYPIRFKSEKTLIKHFTAVINTVWIPCLIRLSFFQNPVRSGSELQNPVGSRSGNRIMFNTGVGCGKRETIIKGLMQLIPTKHNTSSSCIDSHCQKILKNES